MSIIILFLIVLIVMIFTGPKLSGLLNARSNILTVVCYLGLLSALSLVCFLLPSGALAQKVSPSYYLNSMASLSKQVKTGHYGVPKGFTGTHQSYSLSGQSVSITSTSGDISVYLGTKGVDAPDDHSGKIDVYCYCQYDLEADSYRLSATMQPSALFFNGKSLDIKSLNPKTMVTGYAFDYASQFFNSNEFYRFENNATQIAVILVPKGVRANGNYGSLADL